MHNDEWEISDPRVSSIEASEGATGCHERCNLQLVPQTTWRVQDDVRNPSDQLIALMGALHGMQLRAT
jgi:hypothetical protein